MAERILMASRLAVLVVEEGSCQLAFSVSEPEWSGLDEGWVRLREGRFCARLGSMSRSGDCSVSEEERRVMVGGSMEVESGEPSGFLDRKPVLNLLFLLSTTFRLGCGGSSIGEESCSVAGCGSDAVRGEMEGRATSMEEPSASGVSSGLWGVFSNSARVPSSVSSRHLTPLFSPLIGDLLFLGVMISPFLALPIIPFRLGELFTGVEER